MISEVCTQQYMSACKLHSASSQNLNPNLGYYNQSLCEDIQKRFKKQENM